MTSQGKLDEVLLRWEENRDQGRDVPIEQLCVDCGCPELISEAKQHVDALLAMESLINTGRE